MAKRKLIPVEGQHLKGRLVRLWDGFFKEELRPHADKLIFYCESGPGCSPTAKGTKVYGHFIDGEACYVRRSEIEGIIP